MDSQNTMTSNYRMIDVSEKNETRRTAIAEGTIRVCPETMSMIRSGKSPKGNILAIAEVAGIMAAKNTPQILPLCHPLIIDAVKVWFDVGIDHVKAYCQVSCSAKTGVEMEALVGVNTVLLTIYDLAKAVDPVIEISDVYLREKIGGKSGHWHHPKIKITDMQTQARSSTIAPLIEKKKYSTAVVTMSDRASRLEYEDQSGMLLKKYCEEHFLKECDYKILPDNADQLRSQITQLVEKNIHLILITGGTGLGPRDITPEVMSAMANKEIAGFGELQRQHGAQFTPSSWLSRSSAYVVGNSLVVLLPGSPKAVSQGLDVLNKIIPHALKMIQGGGHE